MAADALSDDDLVALLHRYLTILQGHPGAEEMMAEAEEDPASLVTEGSGPFVKANKLAGEYGLTACAGE